MMVKEQNVRRSPRIWFAEHLLHFGWALFGQECDCGANRFNWLARHVDEGTWDDEGEPVTLWTKIKFNIGHAFVSAHGRIIPRE